MMIKDFVSDVLKHGMRNVDSVLLNTSKSSIIKNVLNCSKIHNKLGWKDETSLRASILDAWNHFKKKRVYDNIFISAIYKHKSNTVRTK